MPTTANDHMLLSSLKLRGEDESDGNESCNKFEDTLTWVAVSDWKAGCSNKLSLLLAAVPVPPYLTCTT